MDELAKDIEALAASTRRAVGQPTRLAQPGDAALGTHANTNPLADTSPAGPLVGASQGGEDHSCEHPRAPHTKAARHRA